MPAKTPPDAIQYGFKRISAANLTELDHQTPHRSRLRGAKWVEACLRPQLEACVPGQIAFLYEVARGSMVYGMFFQPLASLATEQCYRVLEAGARHRCAQLNPSKKPGRRNRVLPDKSFAEIITTLSQAGMIPDDDDEAWQTMPFLRNLYSHPKSQIIQSRETPLEMLAHTAELLNRLSDPRLHLRRPKDDRPAHPPQARRHRVRLHRPPGRRRLSRRRQPAPPPPLSAPT